MRRAFFFIVAVCLATSSFASIPRASALDAPSSLRASLPETRIRVFDVLAPFARPVPSPLNRALHQAYEQASTTNASGLGRFLSVDPVIPTGAVRNPQLWNRYSYVANNPLNRVDPDGRLLQLSGCVKDASSDVCKSQYNLYLSTFGKQSQEAAKYLQIGKNGIVSFNGISGAAFAAKFGMMGAATNFLVSNRAALFSLVTGSSGKTAGAGGSYFEATKVSTLFNGTAYPGGGQIGIDLGAFPQPMGGITQSATGALVHEIGHAMASLFPGLRDELNGRLANSVWTTNEGYSMTFENNWRREQGQDIRLFYKYFYKDVTLSDAPVFP